MIQVHNPSVHAWLYSSLSVVTDVVRLPLHTLLAVSDIVTAGHSTAASGNITYETVLRPQ